LKVEDNLNRKNNSRIGKGQAYRGKAQQTRKGKFPVQKEEAEASSQNEQPQRGGGINFRGRRYSQWIQGRGRGYEVRCYTCGKLGHISWDFSDNVARQGNVQIAEAEVEPRVPEENVEVPEIGEDLLMRIILLKLNNEVHEPA